LRIIV